MSCLVIPDPATHLTASEFTKGIEGLDRTDREFHFYNVLTEGHVPSYMRTFVPVDVTFTSKSGTSHNLRLMVLPDYLTIGIEHNRLRVPLWPTTAQRIADLWNCILPTPKMVALIWGCAKNRVPPQPWGPPYDASMMSTKRFTAHNGMIEAKVKSLGMNCATLTAGHKKDVVITNRLVKNVHNVAIYGWHKLNGQPIQGLYIGHANTYADYSHGVRLIHKECLLDGRHASVEDLLTNPDLCHALSNEGVMQILRQP